MKQKIQPQDYSDLSDLLHDQICTQFVWRYDEFNRLFSGLLNEHLWHWIKDRVLIMSKTDET